MAKTTSDQHWFDLFDRTGTRREFLRVSQGVVGLVALGSLPGCGSPRPRFSTDPFTLGVASGDPHPDGVVLWTRLASSSLEMTGLPADPVDVRWEMASDDTFRTVVARGSGLALPDLGHSLHVEVAGLEPSRDYWYRFDAGGAVSPVGHTRTAPAPDAPTQAIRFAFASCQNYEHGYYTALAHLSREDVDFVVHLGDYIYERRFGSETVREHESGEVTTLDEYRARYATYRGDPDLQAAHQSAPWIVSTDDHEVDNNYADEVAEDEQSPQQLLLRRAAGYQAFYEFMPLRRSSMPSGPDMTLYRRLGFGDLIEMHVLDTRQYRSDQACGDRQKVRCEDALAPHRTMMGPDQERWLMEGMQASSARWNVLANQVMIAQMAGGQPEEPTFAMDRWDGYPVAQQRLLDFLAEARPQNPVVLTGDIHANWVADLKADFDDPAAAVVGTEFVGTSISSGGDGRAGTNRLDRTRQTNPHIRYFNGQRGYVRVEVTSALWRADYRIVPYVSRPGAPVETAASFVVESGRPGAQPA